MKKDQSYPIFDHDAHARTRNAKDFWGQIRRTVNGEPVSNDQIALIVKTIQEALDLNKSDFLLDIACGNGALSQLLFTSCSRYLGVDLSEYLISVARDNFEKRPDYEFQNYDVAEYLEQEDEPERFSKVLCYGSFSYFSSENATNLLRSLSMDFANVECVFIGNLPDKEKAAEFYKREPNMAELSDCLSQIGIWRTRDEFHELASNTGWKLNLTKMPSDFYSSHYRYDALLYR